EEESGGPILQRKNGQIQRAGNGTTTTTMPGLLPDGTAPFDESAARESAQVGELQHGRGRQEHEQLHFSHTSSSSEDEQRLRTDFQQGTSSSSSNRIRRGDENEDFLSGGLLHSESHASDAEDVGRRRRVGSSSRLSTSEQLQPRRRRGSSSNEELLRSQHHRTSGGGTNVNLRAEVGVLPPEEHFYPAGASSSEEQQQALDHDRGTRLNRARTASSTMGQDEQEQQCSSDHETKVNGTVGGSASGSATMLNIHRDMKGGSQQNAARIRRSKETTGLSKPASSTSSLLQQQEQHHQKGGHTTTSVNGVLSASGSSNSTSSRNLQQPATSSQAITDLVQSALYGRFAYKIPSYTRTYVEDQSEDWLNDFGTTKFVSSAGGGLDNMSKMSTNFQQQLPRRLIRLLTRAVSLVLETMPLSSSWTKIYFAERLPFFSLQLQLPTSVIYHHFLPLLHSSSAALLHALLVVTKSWWSLTDSTSVAILDRLFSLVQDTILDPFFRGLCIQWLISLCDSSPMCPRILERYYEIAPRWQDPLELKELKLQFILHALEKRGAVPKNLLVVLDALSEFKSEWMHLEWSDPFCARAVGAHQVVFRFLLRVLIRFPEKLSYLQIPEYFCDLLR
ncbi:unnamed protein product, partial [Amoebophrya sp. A120]